MSRRKIIPYNPELKDLARELRKNMTLSEVLLWNELKNKNMGYDFDRQRPIGNYIVDFFCKDLSLVIEIDGDTHTFRYDYDDERQQSLEAIGLHFLRFDDHEVKKNLNNVLRVIGDWIEKNEKEINPIRAEPTPNLPLTRNRHSEEGNKNSKIQSSDFEEPTPNPSEEGNKNNEIRKDG